MFRSLSFVGVASAAIIESRPHEHLQMANAQLQNATEAVIKTAAVAGLAYAGAYMAAAGTTPGAYDSSRRSQASSTGQRYCDTRETDPLKYKCTADFFNGNKVNNAADNQAKVSIRNYWCCPAADLGGKYSGDMNGVCGSQNSGVSVFAAAEQGLGGCVYHGPCIAGGSSENAAGGNKVKIDGKTIEAKGTQANEPTQTTTTSSTGACNSIGNDQGVGDGKSQPAAADLALALGQGIFGGVPGGYNNNAGTGLSSGAGLDGFPRTAGGANLGSSSGLARRNGVDAFKCCMKTDQGDDGTYTYSLDPAVLTQPISFCVPNAMSTPKDYTCNLP